MSIWTTSNVLLYSVQLALVVFSGWLVCVLLRIRMPRLLLTRDYALLILGVVQPLLTIVAPQNLSELPVVARFTADAQGAAVSIGRAVDGRMLAAVWLTGALLRLVLLAGSLFRLRKLRRHARLMTVRPSAIDDV